MTAGIIKIGTRGSKLALWQANWVRSSFQKLDPSLDVELVIIKTKGDKILDVPLAKIGGKGLFVKEIEEALLDGSIDLAVHSMKDMPAEIPKNLCIGAIPERENPFDVLVSGSGLNFSQLGSGARIGTSSLRRSSQLLHQRSDIQILPLRGNLDTRIKKLDLGEMDAIILAAAGIRRLGFEDRITEYLDENIMLPAVGQGALCLEIRADDAFTADLTSKLDHYETRVTVLGERAFLKKLEGGCQVPIAAFGKITNKSFSLCGLVADVEGKSLLKETLSGDNESSESIGIELANRLLSMGAKEILEDLNRNIKL